MCYSIGSIYANEIAQMASLAGVFYLSWGFECFASFIQMDQCEEFRSVLAYGLSSASFFFSV